jgi:pimeloyl-ACP methyl ester carboxylesterase
MRGPFLHITSADGTVLSVETTGPEDGTPILLLHGVSSSSLTYDWLPDEVTDSFRVVTLDFRGHGQSAHTPGTYTLRYYYDDAVAVLEKVIKRPAIVAGFSLGATVGWRLAQKRPDLVSAVLLEEPIIYPADVYADGTIPRVLRYTIEQEIDWQQRGVDLDVAAAELGANAAGPNVSMSDVLYPDSIRALAASTIVRDRGVTEAAIDGSMTDGVDPTAPPLVPTVIVAGGDDRGTVFVTKHAERVQKLHSDVVVHRNDQAGHGVHTSLWGREQWLGLLLHLAKSVER